MSADHALNADKEVIYVKITDEVVEVWRPVQAKKLADNKYVIESNDMDPEIELWEFRHGDIVKTELQIRSGEYIEVAVSKA